MSWTQSLSSALKNPERMGYDQAPRSAADFRLGLLFAMLVDGYMDIEKSTLLAKATAGMSQAEKQRW
jgi:hypothetical protein